MNTTIIDFLLKSESKALASIGSMGINVIPVSTIFIEDDTIFLVDYFMDKTIKNILENNNVSIVAWSQLEGYQIKCIANYETEGERVENIKSKVKDMHPDRDLKGLLILRPQNIFDISVPKR
jgi:uncharacterized pyridoxamine 5'-phosphate oxidase family protein